MMSTFFWIFFFVIQSQAGRIRREEDIFDFEVCPESHPYAFSRGQKCCSKQNLNETEFWISDACEADAIDCAATQCEDLNEDCYRSLSVTGESDHGGIYKKIDYLEANRPIYKKEEGDSCIWWHQPYRHWLIGPCENVGTYSGYAYLEEDTSCPELYNGRKATWRRGDSDEVIVGFSATPKVQDCCAQTLAVEPSSSGPTAGVNVIVREGKYKQSCRFVIRNGQFRCEKI
jgi:hypothetical protein